MRRAEKSIQKQHVSDGLIPAIVLAACFVCSALVGCLFVSGSGESSTEALNSYLHSYLTMLAEGEKVWPSIWSVVWEICCWPLLVFLLGLTALGALAIPAVFCVRGFLLSYAVAAFVSVFGHAGLLAAFAVFGMTVFVSIPVLFCMGAVSFPSSLRLARGIWGERLAGPYYKEFFVSLVPCTILVVLASVIQWSVMPQLLCIISERLIA